MYIEATMLHPAIGTMPQAELDAYSRDLQARLDAIEVGLFKRAICIYKAF